MKQELLVRGGLDSSFKLHHNILTIKLQINELVDEFLHMDTPVLSTTQIKIWNISRLLESFFMPFFVINHLSQGNRCGITVSWSCPFLNFV